MPDRDPDQPGRRALLRGLAGGAALVTGAAGAAPAAPAQAPPPAAGEAARGSSGARGYYACALQVAVDAVHPDATRAAARQRMGASLARVDTLIEGSRRWIGPDLQLLVLPEYFLTGFPWGESVSEWADKAALDPDGAEYAALGAIAQKHRLYLAGNAYETDRHFPGLYFQASFVVAPSGEVVLRYRRLVSLFAPTPHDVWDRYLDLYGLDGVFPVARTAIGNLAAIASEEILYPEIARCHAMRGAEVFLHSSSEAYTATTTQKKIARQARALENLACLVSANTAGVRGIDVPVDSANGGSDVIDYLGNVLVAAGMGETMTACARIDLAGLREYRRRPGMPNLLSRQAFDLFAASYAQADFRRRNGLWRGGAVVVPDRGYFVAAQRETIARLESRGLLAQ
jgi:deaminated glutathione amidase